MPKREIPTVSKNIKRFRAMAGLTQEDLADRANISSVKMIESGKNVGRISTLLAIAEALGVTMGDLFEDPDDSPMNIGDRLRTARAETTQSELAERSGVTQSQISQIERGVLKNPGAGTLLALESALNLPRGHLTSPQGHDASLDRFMASDYGKDANVTPEELERLRGVNWKGPTEDAPPAAWAALLEAIRKKDAATPVK